MNSLSKVALAVTMLGSIGTATGEANAGVALGVTIGTPAVAVHVGNPCFRPFGFRPAYCGHPLYGRPIFVDGIWYRGPIYVRSVHGVRYLWFRGRWERERIEWRR